ncbi:MAG: RnfH family protein [Burkholderiales bacterium]
MRVEIVYASLAGTTRLTVEVPTGTTLREAVAASGLPTRHPELGPDMLANASVYGERRDPAVRLEEGDRIELCRPLTADPKEARRRRRARR